MLLDEPESRWVCLARQGDVAAFEALVRRYQDVAFRVAYLITGSATDAEDAAQEGFLRAYHALDRFRVDAPFRPWILQIVANAARTKRAAAVRRSTLSLSAVDEHLLEGSDQSPEGVALKNERQRELVDAINALGDTDRLFLTCRYFLDLSEAETASAIGCARGTVKSRLSRALGRLREQLAAMPPTESTKSEDEATHE